MDALPGELTHNVAPLLALVILHSALLPRLRRGERRVELMFGLLFGLTAVIGMAYPFVLEPGLIFDGRSVVLSLAGFFGGPLVAAIAAVIAAGYRIWIGGSGLWMGLGVIVTAAAIGVIGHRLKRSGRIHPRSSTFLALGLVVHLCSLLWMLALPSELRWMVTRDISGLFLGVLTLMTWVVGQAFQLGESRDHALREASEAEERFRNLVAGSQVGVYLLQDGRFIYANPALESTFGYRRGDMIGRLAEDLVAPEDRARVLEQISASLDRERNVVRYLVRAQHADGHSFQAEVFGSRTRLAGHPAVVGMVVDVTERERAAQRQAESERRFRSLVSAIPDLVWLKDCDGTYLTCNQAFERFVGHKEADIVGKTDLDFVERELAEFFRQKDREALAAGKPTMNEEVLTLAADGRTIQVESIRTALFDADGNLVGVLGVARDITQRKQAEAELERGLSHARMMLGTMTDGYVRLDVQGRILDTNPAYCRMLGYDRAELIGRSIADFRAPGAEYDVPMCIDHVLSAGQMRFDTRYRRKDGGIIDIEASAASMPKAEPPQLAVFFRDVTQERRVEANYRELVNRIPAGVFRYRTIKSGGRFEYVSPAFCILLQVDEHAARADPASVFERLHPEDAAVFAELRAAARSGARSFVWGGQLKLGDRIRWVHVEAGATAEAGGDLVWHGVVTDVTERQQLLERLRLDSAVIASTSESVMITDLDANIVSVNPAFSEMTGRSADEVVGQNARLLKSGHHDASFYQDLWRELKESGRWQGQIWNRRKSGELYPDLLNISVVRDSDGRPTHYVGIASDISQLKHSEAQLVHLAHHDALTGLPNRLLLGSRLEHAIERARRENAELAVLFLDMDRFKTVNDSLGHEVGDQLLVAVAERLKKGVLREEDTLGRLGGDEFLILLENIGSSMAAAKVAQKLLGALGQPFVLASGHELFIQASIGICLFPADGDRAEILIRNADTAMFRAKEQGRNTYQFYTEALTRAASVRLDLEMRMRRGIRNNEFQVWYQPIYRFADRRIVGAEALIRWQPADGAMIPPDQFIPVAEDSGMIVELGRQVLQTGCADLRGWIDQGLKIESLAVNLSAQQFRDRQFERTVAQDIAAAGVPPQMLELEVTERGLMDLGSETLGKLDALKKLGVCLAIDDFGTGYSSLTYLKQMPVDKLKIDRSFVEDLPDDASNVAIVRTIVAIARSLCLKVLAEGVETSAQLAFLRDIGCDECQGFLFGRAVPAPQFAEQLRAQEAQARP